MGFLVGESVGDKLGASEGSEVGLVLGRKLGGAEGIGEGEVVGSRVVVGARDGPKDGPTVGEWDKEGRRVLLGPGVGGVEVGEGDGRLVSVSLVGDGEGAKEGDEEGKKVGRKASEHTMRSMRLNTASVHVSAQSSNLSLMCIHG